MGDARAEIDYRPVLATVSFETLQEKGQKGERERARQGEKYTNKNEILERAYKAHITMTNNPYRQKQEEVTREEGELVDALQRHLQKQIMENWNVEQSVNKMQQAIDRALKNTYNDLLRETHKRKDKIRKEFLQESTWLEIKRKNRLWAEVRDWWHERGIQGWEQKINRAKAKIRNEQGVKV